MIETRFNPKIPFYLFLATISTLLISLFLFQIFAVLLVFFWLIEKNKSKSEAFDRISLLFFVFILVRIASLIFSKYAESSLPLLYKDGIFFLSFFAMSFYLKLFAEKKVKAIVLTFVVAAMIVALVGIIKFNFGLVNRAESFSSGYMAYSLYLLASLGIGLLLYNFINEKRYVVSWTAGLALIISGIIVSLGRTNIALAILVFIVSLFFLKENRWFSIGIVLLTVVLAFISFQLNTKEVNARVEHPAGMSDRDILWGNAKDLILKFEYPLFGYGPRTFDKVFTERDKLQDVKIGSWHNDYIQLYLESGILGLLSFLILIGYALFAALKCFLQRRIRKSQKALLIGAVISMISLLLAALTSGFINSPVIAVVFGFFLALISSIIYPVEKISDKLIAEEIK
jgi:O-antigen ligase